MRWLAAAGLVLTAACGSSAAAPGTHGAGTAATGCGPRAARTLAADRQARIYSLNGAVYGCANGSRQALLLGRRSRSRPGQDQVGVLALAGVMAGYAASQPGVDTLSTQVVVRRLDRGRTLHDVNAVRGPLGPEFFESVDAIVVKPDGAVAWIASGGSIARRQRETEVNRLDRRGEATLDSGSGVGTRSLALKGSRLSWRHGKTLWTSTLL